MLLRKSIPIQIHYLVSDKNGNVAVIEFLRGKMVVHTGDELPVPLTTNYKYDSEVKKLVDFLSFGSGDEIELLGPEPMNRDNWKNSMDKDTLKANSLRRSILENSFKRCIIGAYKLKKYQKKLDKPFIDCAFDILESMHIYSKKDKDTWNILSTVFDPINMQIYYYTKKNSEIRKLAFKDFDLITPSSGVMYDMNKNINNTKKDFIPYSDNINTELVQKYSIQFSKTMGLASDSQQYREMQREYNDIAKHPKTIQYPNKATKE
jgi:penicillin V acylase-like amidase (Ntn superfamily)